MQPGVTEHVKADKMGRANFIRFVMLRQVFLTKRLVHFGHLSLEVFIAFRIVLFQVCRKTYANAQPHAVTPFSEYRPAFLCVPSCPLWLSSSRRQHHFPR